MSLNDTTLEGDYYNLHFRKASEESKDKKPDDFDIIADSIADNMFNQPNPLRRIYESIKNRATNTTLSITRRGRQICGLSKRTKRDSYR